MVTHNDQAWQRLFLIEHVESGQELNAIAPETFTLPTFGPRLRDLSCQIHYGRGAVILKGLQPDKYDSKSNIILFAGLSSWIGDQRGRQGAQNDVLSKSLCIGSHFLVLTFGLKHTFTAPATNQSKILDLGFPTMAW